MSAALSFVFGYVYFDYKNSTDPGIRADAELMLDFFVAFVVITITSCLVLFNFLRENSVTKWLFYFQITAVSLILIIVMFHDIFSTLLVILAVGANTMLQHRIKDLQQKKLGYLIYQITWLLILIFLILSLDFQNGFLFIMLILLLPMLLIIQEYFNSEEFLEIFGSS